jgi:hypothetical protein
MSDLLGFSRGPEGLPPCLVHGEDTVRLQCNSALVASFGTPQAPALQLLSLSGYDNNSLRIAVPVPIMVIGVSSPWPDSIGTTVTTS